MALHFLSIFENIGCNNKRMLGLLFSFFLQSTWITKFVLCSQSHITFVVLCVPQKLLTTASSSKSERHFCPFWSTITKWWCSVEWKGHNFWENWWRHLWMTPVPGGNSKEIICIAIAWAFGCQLAMLHSAMESFYMN